MNPSDHTDASDVLDGMDIRANRLIAQARIMMVDDEPINMQVLQLHLEAEGYDNIQTLSDPARAMDALRQDPPDVLLLDLNMPVVSGYDLLTEIRGDSELARTPIIVLTSSNDPETKLKALQLGATDFLSKPVDASELALRMRNTIATRVYEQRIMHFDALTNLPNRVLLTDTLRQYLGDSSGPPASPGCETDSPVALILINIERFKAINDSFGNDRGDDLLWMFSQRLQQCFRNDDGCQHHLIARLGGDRFAVLRGLSASSGPEDAHLRRYLDAFVREMETPFRIEGQDVFLTVSVGVSTSGGECTGVEQLISHAESAMRHGRDHIEAGYAFYSTDMQAHTRRRLVLENGLRQAVDNRELRLLYQPKVNLGTSNISGVEALLRWEHPELGAVSPMEFIPVAEETGTIVGIGHWVLLEACRQAVRFRARANDSFRMAVNVSIRQLYEPAFLDRLRAALEISGLAPEALIVELTENMIMEDVATCVRLMEAMRAIGVRLSIDDFGTGYSSLAYLQQFPINQLKIDRSFVSKIQEGDVNAPIVKSITALAHELSMDVVAEGAETALQVDVLRSLGCDEYQGYYCSPPVDCESIDKMLQQQSVLRKIA